MPAGAPRGPRLTRRATATKRTRESLASVAYQIGVLVAIQRNRWDYNQTELANEVGVRQTDISRIENGSPPNQRVTDAKFDALFGALDLADADLQVSFLKWWRDNG